MLIIIITIIIITTHSNACDSFMAVGRTLGDC